MERCDDVIRCSIEKEMIPKNPVNLKILLSTFEKTSPSTASASLRRRRPSPSRSDGDDDHCQPSMAEVLMKFRQLEKGGRRRGRGGWKRSSSADRVRGRRSSVDDGKTDFWAAGDEVDGDSSPPSQTTTLIALFSQMEGKKKKKGTRRSLGLESRSFARTEVEQRQAAKRNSSEVSVTFQGHPIAHESEEMVEMPEEGLVQTLLTQWKALEKTNAKKKKTWTPPQINRQSDMGQRKGQTKAGAAASSSSFSFSFSYPQTPAPNQKTPPTNASCQASTPPKTTVAPKKTTETPQTISMYKTTTAAGPNTGASGNKPNSQTANVQIKDVAGSDIGGGRGGAGGGEGRGGGREEQAEECSAPLEGIARNITEKFRWMEMKNSNSQTPPRSKSFKWEVKEPSQLGGSRSVNCVSHQPGLTSDLAKTLTPPSSPDFDHFDLQRKSEFFNRQPDTVEQSSRKTEDWKDEFPFPCQTRNLLERYEALLAHN